MSWDGAHYEIKTVGAFSHSVDRTITAWENRGWELVAQPPGGLRRELYFRRIKHRDVTSHARPALGRRPIVIAGVVALAIVLAVVIGTRGDEPAPAAAAAASTTEPTTEPTSAPTTDGADASGSGAGIVSVDTDDDLAALVAVDDPCSPSVGRFARTHAGRTLELDGNIAATRAAGADRYDVLIHAGDYRKGSTPGADFGFQGVTLDDLHLAAGRDYVSAGDNVSILAVVGAFNAEACVLLLAPASTDLR